MGRKTGNDNEAGEILDSKRMIEEAKRERQFLLNKIEESQQTIARSYALIKQLDTVLDNIKEG